MSYIYSHLNEGFNINNRRLVFTDAHEKVLNTSFDGAPTVSQIFVATLNSYVKVYSIFKRCRQIDSSADSNPVVYALKKENGWDFKDEATKQLFWNRFTQLLRRFLRDHKGEFDTTIVVPSSKRLNSDIANEIKKIAEEVGIGHISDGGLYTVSAESVLDAAWADDSYFRRFWKDNFESAFEKLEHFANIMERDNDGLFKYHTITDNRLRRSVLNTLDVDKKKATLYAPYINDKNVMVIDDSIMHGQTIRNSIFALSMSYVPKTVSVLTMFSQLYDENGNEIKK